MNGMCLTLLRGVFGVCFRVGSESPAPKKQATHECQDSSEPSANAIGLTSVHRAGKEAPRTKSRRRWRKDPNAKQS